MTQRVEGQAVDSFRRLTVYAEGGVSPSPAWLGRSAARNLEELIETEEFAAQGAGVGGPLRVAGIDGEGGADGGELGIEVVHVVEGHGFADHGELWRAKFVLAVMADEEMLDDGFQVGRETLDGVHGFGDSFEFHHDVAEELAFDGVADGALVAKFVELADVVQNRGRQQQINVELRVVGSDLPREAAQADDVLEQAAEISVVHHFRRGRSEEHTSELQS